MTTRLVRLEALALAALALAACTDNRKDLLAPPAPDKMILPPGGGIVIGRPILPSPDDFMEIAAAGNHTCARKYNGNVYCWGLEGEAGYGTVLSTPTLSRQGAVQIAVGAAHACSRDSNGFAYCWGGGQSGQLGIQIGAQIGYGAGDVLGPKDPNSYYGTLPPLAFTSISASGSSTCGIASSGLYCWGLAGNVTPQQFTSIPTLIVTPNNYSPLFTQVAIGGQHVCGTASWAQDVECWGADQYGQAGEDPSSAFYYPNTKIVMVGMGTGISTGASRIAAQGDFTCADMYSGIVQCFGYNYDGELGNAPGTFTWVPQSVGGGKGLRGVATGYQHACALDANNEAWCWGRNYWGQVGNGAWSYSTPTVQKVNPVSTSPGQFGATIKFRALAGGNEHSCGISTDNHIYCWGHNNLRQLGTNLYGINAAGQIYLLNGGYTPNPVLVM